MTTKNIITEKSRKITSKEAAMIFFNKLSNGDYDIETLPNKAENFTGKLEALDYIEYKKFIQSRAGLFLLNALDNDK